MTFWTFVREQWRTVLFYLLGNLLLTLVLVFARMETGNSIPFHDVGYAELLAVFMLVLYICVEYWIRRPFYRDVQSRLDKSLSISEGDVPLPASTEEQRQYALLLKHYHALYMRKLAELEERQQFFETFTTRFAHQMKTPVTAIRLLEQEMREASRVEPGRQAGDGLGERADRHEIEPVRDQLNQLAVEVSRIEASIDAMMYTARLNAFSFDAHMEPVDVTALLRSVVNQYKSDWIRHKVFPRLEPAEGQVSAVTDLKWFRFMVDQIVRNALQYGYRTDDTGSIVSAEFLITAKDLGDQVVIDFADNGIGIPERDLRHVFEPFYTGVNGRTHSRATGMGLYLVREVADKLGHEVTIRSQEGAGTTVSVVIHRSEYYRPAASSSL